MILLAPQPPFVWPEPRMIAGMASYKENPPYEALALTSKSLFGIVSGLTANGIDVMRIWLERNTDLKACLVVMVYPACATRQADLAYLLDLVERQPNRLSIHVRPLEHVDDRAANALCFLAPDSQVTHLAMGPTEDLGLTPRQDGHANFVFRADPVAVESFKRYFDWLWACSRDLAAEGVLQIPTLVLPEGTEEGARLWRAYKDEHGDAALWIGKEQVIAQIDPETGDVTLRSEDGNEVVPPTEELGLKKLDELADYIARLYAKGSLVSIDKLSRIPPLDAPLDPSTFGDSAETHQGNVVRRVSMRVSIIDERTLKDIDKYRQGVRTLLTKFTFGLADNMRWMPNSAHALFESEMKRLNEAGRTLISDLLKGGIDAFIEGKRSALIADINGMYATLGRSGPVTDDVITKTVDSLKARLGKAQSSNFMPKLSYSHVGITFTESATASPWGQAYSLLADVATFPRKALTDPFFFRSLKVPEDELIDAMNVADDALCRDLGSRGIKNRSNAELALLGRIEKASIESRDKCELVSRILVGHSIAAIDETLTKAESA